MCSKEARKEQTEAWKSVSLMGWRCSSQLATRDASVVQGKKSR